jgi:hypothetical protein
MRRTYPLIIVGGMMIVALIFSLAPAQEAHKAAGNAPQAWEYHTLLLSDTVNVQEALKDPKGAAAGMDAKFNELGRDGWELAAPLPGVVVFKRPKR